VKQLSMRGALRRSNLGQACARTNPTEIAASLRSSQ
jgi:hypothetical protein